MSAASSLGSGLGAALVFLAATVIAVPLAKRYKLGAVLGYLAAGVAIGPDALKLISDPQTVLTFSEIGVVLLLFVLGLELSPPRLKAMRRIIFGVGLSQVLATTAAFSIPLYLWLGSVSSALVLGFALSISSTAFAVQLLAERGELNTEHGRGAFGVSLFQDLAAVPVVALIPLLAAGVVSAGGATGQAGFAAATMKVLGAIALVILMGRFVLRPVLRMVAEVRVVEVFAAMSLLVVLGTAFLMHEVGLSMGLGAFLAGVLLAESEYATEVESHIEPFRGLLLGLFFIAVGMNLDLDILRHDAVMVAWTVLGVLALKGLVMAAVAYAFGFRDRSLYLLAVLIACGGEFAFVVLDTALKATILSTQQAAFFNVVVAVSMLLTPILVLGVSYWLDRRPKTEQPYEEIPDHTPQVVIAGYGRVGQIVSRVLQAQKIPYLAIDKEAEQVAFVRSRFDRVLYYGDATRPEILRATRLEQAKLLVIAVDDAEASVRIARMVRRQYPKIKILARARNRQHVFRLMDLGVDDVFRETFDTSLRLTHRVLEELGFSSEVAADRVLRFRLHDEELLLRQHLIYDNDAAVVQTVSEAMKDLENLFVADESEPKRDPLRTP